MDETKFDASETHGALKFSSCSIGTERAAMFLAEHLDQDYENQLKFLKKDQRRKNQEIPAGRVGVHEGFFFAYYPQDLCEFVARRNPTALGYPPNWDFESCAKGSTYLLDLQIRCHYEDGGRFTVALEENDWFYGKREVTPEVARKLGQQFISAANYCDEHIFDREKWKPVPRKEIAATSLMELLKTKKILLRSKEKMNVDE